MRDNNQKPTVNLRIGCSYKRYYWTHGCCVHWGHFCNEKKPGHQDFTSFANSMGGCNRDAFLSNLKQNDGVGE